MRLSEQSFNLITSRCDVLDIVDQVSGVFRPMIPTDEHSVALFKGVAEKKAHELLGANSPPNGYTRYTFQRLTVKAALELDAERREIDWSEPIDWSNNV